MARQIIKDGPDRVLRDTFKLKKWSAKPPERRAAYFGWCDDLLARLEQVAGEDGPDDEAVMAAIAAMLQSDDTFTEHIAKRQRSEFLTEEENWRRVRRAAAGQIYQEYLLAKEKSKWP